MIRPGAIKPPKKTMFLLLTLTVTLTILNVNCESKLSFCGSKLSKILEQYCISYPTHNSELRVKRQIVKECCVNQCTLTYLLNNYCQTINTDAMVRTIIEKIEPENQSNPLRPSKRKRRLSKKSNVKNIRERCTCKRKLKKKAKKEQKILREKLKNKSPVPEARIGHIENHSTGYFIHKM